MEEILAGHTVEELDVIVSGMTVLLLEVHHHMMVIQFQEVPRQDRLHLRLQQCLC